MTVLTPAQIAQYAYDAGFRGDALVTAVAVSLAESGGNPRIPGDVGLENGTWGPSIGLWQIRSLNSQKGTGGVRDELANDDPAVAARHAFTISSHGHNWQPWSAYTNGSYRSHLSAARRAAHSVHTGGHGGSGHGGTGHGGTGHGGTGHGGHGGWGHGGKGHGGKGHGKRPRRIVLDLAELQRIEQVCAGSSAWVLQSNDVVRQVGTELDLVGRQRPDPAAARNLSRLFLRLEGERGLPMVARHIDYDTRLVNRIRQLAEAADSPDGQTVRNALLPYLRHRNGKLDLTRAAVLEALTSGGLRRPNSPAGAPGAGAPAGAPAIPAPPPPQPMNTGDFVPASLAHYQPGKLPSSQLVRISNGEQLWNGAAAQYLRMAAAARTAGLQLHVIDGYRSVDELKPQGDPGTGGAAAPGPGRLSHGWGLSVDVDVASNPAVSQWLSENAARYGFFNDVPGDPDHWTYRPAAAA